MLAALSSWFGAGMNPVEWNEGLLEQAEEVCRVARECSRRGWLPATAGNFSFRDASAPMGAGRIFITSSGLDKGILEPKDLLEIDADCRVIAGPEKAKPSAETLLHGVIYRDRPGPDFAAKAIFHVHTIANTSLPDLFVKFAGIGKKGRAVPLENYELLKALSGVTTHEYKEFVPILDNSQDYPALAAELTDVLEKHPKAHGVLLLRHGLYTWGASIAEAWRHLEALEFLFEVESRLRCYGY
jgi:methylthioribulose-1-phosphate dehydratase